VLQNFARSELAIQGGCTRRFFATSSYKSNCYELRTYAVLPNAFPDFVKLTNEMLHLRLAHSKLIGYWLADLGALNQAVHIWEYDSYTHRKEVRANLAADQTWLSTYLMKMLKMLAWQDNATMNQVPWCSIESQPFKEAGVYELKEMLMKPGGPQVWGDAMKRSVLTQAEAHSKHKYGKLMGAWSGDFGQSSSFYQLWNYESLDHRLKQKAEIESLPEVRETGAAVERFMTEHVTSKALLPMPFSPLK
ncbi:protein NipSnap homolog 3A-like, partial [Anneissia japonica]|uniref:protein NipSnap homolog 3A-like n=1 Tax=Anneissia japonica TaxID=1529436 RepID=UPI0014256274